MTWFAAVSLLACTSSPPIGGERSPAESPTATSVDEPPSGQGPVSGVPPPAPSPDRGKPPGARRSAAEERLLNASPWLAGRDYDLGRRWWAGSEPRLATALRASSLLHFALAPGRGIAIELWEHSRDDVYQIAVKTLPHESATCFTCGGETQARFVSAVDNRLTFEAVDGIDLLCALKFRNRAPTSSPASAVELHADGTFVACGMSTRLVPGVSPQTRWWQLEQEAAGPVPDGFERCYVVRDPDCTSPTLRARCIRANGEQAFVDGGPDPLHGEGGELCLDSPHRASRLSPEEEAPR